MELLTIRQVSKTFGLSTRTLRYYEQIGLLQSVKKDEYAYRAYDEAAVRRLRQVVVLKKLRIPLKQIKDILEKQDTAAALDTFIKKADEIQSEIDALSTLKEILNAFIARLRESSKVTPRLDLLSDEVLVRLAETLTLTEIAKEENTMEELNQADLRLTKLNDVRIVYLPPATVAASHYIGESPEDHAGQMLNEFIEKSGLLHKKPDARHYGFNHPNPSCDKPVYGYEMWVTIPEDMEVPAPLVKKHFPGGLYAAHMIPFGNFSEWRSLIEWAHQNDKYAPNMTEDGGECMYGLIEETLNFRNRSLSGAGMEGLQLDLLCPIKEK